MAYYVGVDAGLRSSSLCIVDELGAVCLERTVASEIEEIAGLVWGFEERVEGLALETGNLAPWLAAGLRAEGLGWSSWRRDGYKQRYRACATRPTGTTHAVMLKSCRPVGTMRSTSRAQKVSG